MATTEQILIEERARQLANEIARENSQLNSLLSNGRIFTQFNYDSDIIENQKEIVTSALWSDGTTSLDTFFTASYQSSTQKEYYYDITQTASTTESEFSITYGHIYGSGSLTGSVQTFPTKAIYRQYKQILLDAGSQVFTFDNNVTSNHIYVLNVKRERFKQRLDPGNWQLNLAKLNGSAFANNFYTGSNVAISGSGLVMSLIDDSDDSNQSVSTLTESGRVYNVISGSITNGAFTAFTGSFGLLYPDQGIIVLNADMLNEQLGFNTVTGSNLAGNNQDKLFKSMSGSVLITGTGSFEGRASEVMTSNYYYCRLKNNEYNFSTNPSFTTGSIGDLRHQVMIQDPKVYLTTIGLYNDRQELLAVGKLSTPILKTFATEANIKVKLDW